MRYYLSVLWHFVFMASYYLITAIGLCLEVVMMFMLFVIGGYLISRDLYP